MRHALSRMVKLGCICATAGLLISCAATFNFVSPAPNATLPPPVATNINWTADLQSNTLAVVIDPGPNATDVTSQFSVSGSSATANLPIPAGPHTLSVSGNLWSSYSQSYQFTSTSQSLTVVGGPDAVLCSIFDDGNTNEEGPSNYIQFSDGQACLSVGAPSNCRKWFGDCSTVTTKKKVHFMVFDDGYSNMRGPTDAVYIRSTPQGYQSCEPDATPVGTCRKWFGLAYTSDGIDVMCQVFNYKNGSPSPPTDAVYVLPGPSDQNSCAPADPAVLPNGFCRQNFGHCQTVTGSGRPITYQLTVTGTPGPDCVNESQPNSSTFGDGCPVGSLGTVQFGTGTDAAHPVVDLVFSFEGNTENVVPFFADRPCLPNCPNDGIYAAPGFLNAIGSASITIKEHATGNVLAQGKFLPSAGIFVSVDQGNKGIGFGCFGVIPPDPAFPDKIEPLYPYALVHASTDLKSNFSASGLGFSASSKSLQLPTTAGVLVINTDSFNTSASFSATLH